MPQAPPYRKEEKNDRGRYISMISRKEMEEKEGGAEGRGEQDPYSYTSLLRCYRLLTFVKRIERNYE